MLEITADAIMNKHIKTVGLLATEGTIKSGIYQKVFDKRSIKVILPNEKEQQVITDLIYKGVKAGKKDYDVTNVKQVMQNIINSGAEILVLGCTELPVAVDMYKLEYNVCDPTLELAKASIKAVNMQCI